MVAIGEGENLLVTVKVGGELDIFSFSLTFLNYQIKFMAN